MKKSIIASLLLVSLFGCQASEPSTVNPLRIQEIDVVPIFCGGGGPDLATVSLFATGGSGIYQYRVDGGDFGSSNVFANLTPGTHVFDVQDSNGTSVGAAIVTDPSGFNAISIAQAPYCADRYNRAIITYTSQGGIGPIFTLNEGTPVPGNDGQFGPLEAGEYTIVADDDSTGLCSPVSISFAVIIPQASGNANEDFVNAKHCIQCIPS